MDTKKLKMSFDPHTIEHLGVKMYSVLPNAIAELIANAYDAEATEVHVKLVDKDNEKSISVIDNGVGMSFDEINNHFLRIGRKRREEDKGFSPNSKRKVTGRKGLGKLAFFGIGDTIKIKTCQGNSCVSFVLRWNELMKPDKYDYEPEFKITQCVPDEHGTTIELCDLKRKSGFNVNDLAASLSKLFNFFDDTFKVYISYNEEDIIQIDDKLKYQNLVSQIIWEIPSVDIPNEYLKDSKVTGRIIATEKPLKPGLRGITLFAHGRLINAPEFFGVGESSHGYSYLTGWLDVDFIDELEDDVISTDRQSLNWDLPVTEELQLNLRQLLQSIERDWRSKRKKAKQKKVSETTEINISQWYETLPNDVQVGVENIVSSIIEHSELESDKQSEVIGALHALVPEYTNYHWRHIHEQVQEASFEDYKNGDFYRATEEAIKRYESNVRMKAGCLDRIGRSVMERAFGNNGLLSVASKYKKMDGSDFHSDTIENIEEGQKYMSMGMMSGVRNPLSHEEKKELKNTGFFSEKDCLDILSLLSHLFRRLDDATCNNSNIKKDTSVY